MVMMETKLGVNFEVKLGVGSKTGSKNSVLAFLKCTDGSALAFLKCTGSRQQAAGSRQQAAGSRP